MPEPRPEFTDSLLTRLQAVEQLRVVSAPPAPVAIRGAQRLRMFAAGAVAVGLLGVVGYVASAGTDEVPITMTASFGSVEIIRDDDTVIVEPGEEASLRPGDTVVLGGDSEATIDGEVITGGRNGVSVVLDHDGGVSLPGDEDLAVGETDSSIQVTPDTEPQVVPSLAVIPATVTAEVTESPGSPTAADASTTTGSSAVETSTSSSQVPSTTVVTTPTVVVPAPSVPAIPPSTTVLQAGTDPDDDRPGTLQLLSVTTDGQMIHLTWEPYVGDDFGRYVVLFTRGDDANTVDSPSYPIGTSTTEVQDVIVAQATSSLSFAVPAGGGVVSYRVVATNGPAVGVPTPDGNDYGKLIALSAEQFVPLSDPASTIVEHTEQIPGGPPRANLAGSGDGGEEDTPDKVPSSATTTTTNP